jgi:cell wall assembly regulator SMI1
LTEAARDAWKRLELWCRRHHPPLLDFLNPGASEDEIVALERVIGQPLPTDVRVSLSIHNGDREYGFVFGLTLLSIAGIENDWRMWQDCLAYNEEPEDDPSPDLAVALDYANPGWIPLTRDAGNNHLGVDLAPGPAGVAGQVINFGKDEEEKCVLAAGWAEFLAGYAVFLESGAVREIYPDNWYDRVRKPIPRHPHDMLREWRQQGRWPPRCGSVVEPSSHDVQFWRAWNNGTVIDLARGIRDQGRTDEVPLLADALEDAGCTQADLLDLCRNGIPQIDGAWLLGVLLEKE